MSISILIITFVIMVLFSPVIGAGLNIVCGHLALLLSQNSSLASLIGRALPNLEEVCAADVGATRIFQWERDTS